MVSFGAVGAVEVKLIHFFCVIVKIVFFSKQELVKCLMNLVAPQFSHSSLEEAGNHFVIQLFTQRF